MKFGKNIDDLSIPEWKTYNLEYKELKCNLKRINDNKNSTLKPLYNKLIDNFNVINLFISTKYGELSRKVDFHENYFESLLANNDFSNIKQVKLDILLSNLIEISIILKKLSKFILIQKIAVKKFIKKFLKQFHNPDKGQYFIYKIKLYLNKDSNSFINFNLFPLTTKLTNLINLIRYEQNKASDDKFEEDNISIVFSNSGNDANVKLNESFNFDLTLLLKKNFLLNFLSPDDHNNFNEVLLNLNIYLNFKEIKNNDNEHFTLNSMIYLQNENSLDHEPSIILSEAGQPYSALVSYIGGLRKYSYCFLPNNIVELLLNYLNNFDNKLLKSDLKNYFHSSNINSLTKLTVESILNNKLSPKLKVYYKRVRFYSKDETKTSQTQGIASVTHEDYLLTLNYDMYTTNNPNHTSFITFEDIESLDKFSFNHLSIHTNDHNLLTFEKGLLTEIDNSSLMPVFPDSSLKKLPKKIQKVIESKNSLNLFKNFSIYQYMLSSYFNMIPTNEYINNQYSKILNLNLYKNFENKELFNREQNIENSIMESNSNNLLRSKISLNDLMNQQASGNDNNEENSEIVNNTYVSRDFHGYTISKEKRPQMTKTNSARSFSSFEWSFANDRFKKNDELEEIIENEDNESLRMFWKDNGNYVVFDQDNRSFINSLIENLIKIKTKFINSSDDNQLDYSSNYYSETEYGSVTNYNYEDQLRNYYQEHDTILSFFYFFSFSISLLTAGTDCGIIYSVIKFNDSRNKISLSQNTTLCFILIIGLVVSFFSSLISIHLMYQGYYRAPISHILFIYLGFMVMLACTIISIVALFN